ncbi:hypothetical protein F4825DRAFT_470577 [Nemania diffusa]|nr:hypothetical protein F4825DRAFT_470577 [Nemania diffusa]
MPPLPHSPLLGTLASPQFSTRSKVTTSNRFGQTNALQRPLNGREIAVTVMGSLAGAALLALISYYCWKHCKPNATYYETAVQLSKKSAARRKAKCCPQQPTGQSTLTRWELPTVLVTPPPAASTRSSFYSDEVQ